MVELTTTMQHDPDSNPGGGIVAGSDGICKYLSRLSLSCVVAMHLFVALVYGTVDKPDASIESRTYYSPRT